MPREDWPCATSTHGARWAHRGQHSGRLTDLAPVGHGILGFRSIPKTSAAKARKGSPPEEINSPLPHIPPPLASKKVSKKNVEQMGFLGEGVGGDGDSERSLKFHGSSWELWDSGIGRTEGEAKARQHRPLKSDALLRSGYEGGGTRGGGVLGEGY